MQVVASQDITEKYLFDFRLVWRCFIDKLAEVMGTTATICCTKPHLLVDGIRAARLLDAVIEVCLRILTVIYIPVAVISAGRHAQVLSRWYSLHVGNPAASDVEKCFGALCWRNHAFRGSRSGD